MNYKENYNEWLTNPYFDNETKNELLSIQNNDDEIKERFSTELEFGTGGLRGIMGAGTSRMNIHNVRKATQGLANYIIMQNKQDKGVAIACDSRNMSPEFSEAAGLVLAANGIKAYVFESLRPTPELSFAIRTLNCVSGINITASHNPPQYNGYKAYWEDGAQITPPHDIGIMDEIEKITDYSTIKTMDKNTATNNGLYITIGKDIDNLYSNYLKNNLININCINTYAKNLNIVYTPLNGAGNIPVRNILDDIGFKNIFVVKEQETPDGNFPTLEYPNPESEKAYTLALELANKVNADIVLATDPDADRLGVCVKDSNNEYHFLTGNMAGSILAEYILGQKHSLNTLPENGYIIKSIVTTNLVSAIAKNYNVTLKEVLTGFKWFGKQILDDELNTSDKFIFGFEESYGYLAGDNVRDKDAIISSMLFCEIAAYCKSQKKTLWDYWLDICNKYGYYKENTTSLSFTGLAGQEKIKSIMEYLRTNPLTRLGDYKVLSIRDYKKDTILNLENNTTSPTGLPSSNVLYYELENNGWLCVRPSGTEPKIKFYYGLKSNSDDSVIDKSEKLNNALSELLKTIV